MDLEEELARREALVAEEEAQLQRLRHSIAIAEQVPLSEKLKSHTLNHHAIQPLTTVNNLRTTVVDIPPSSSESTIVRRNRTQHPIKPDDPYAAEDSDELESITDGGISEFSANELSNRVTLHDEKWSVGRSVNALRFHAKRRDVLLSAHGAKQGGQGGVVNVWAVDGAHSSHQRALFANTEVTALAMPPLSPTTVLGGTSIGAVLTWDLRARATTPVQYGAAVLGRAPVTALEMARNKPEFACSTADGTISIWSLSKLDAPTSKFQIRSKSLVDTIRVTALEIPVVKKLMAQGAARSQSLFAGGEDGAVYRFDCNSVGSWVLGKELKAHRGPVSAISVHPSSRKWPTISELVLSASMDWSIQLSGFAKNEVVPKKFNLGRPAIVNDVKWSPVHPSIFATADEAGGVALFDVERSYLDAGTPFSRHTFKDAVSGFTATPSVNRIQWSKDGRQLAAGDIEGSVSVWKCSDKLLDASKGEWLRLSNFISLRKSSRD